MLAEANPEFEEKNNSRPPLERFEIWWWRFRRRISRDRQYIGTATLGGALGAGLGLGLLRQLLGLILAPEDAGIPFYSHFPLGFLLGAGVSLGLLLVNPLRLRPPEIEGDERGPRPLALALLLGTGGFLLVHLFFMALLIPATLVAEPLMLLVAILAGAGLTLAVHDQPLAGWHLGQLAFVAAGKPHLALIGGRTGRAYDVPLGDRLIEWGMGSILTVERWFDYAAIIDAVLFGVVMALGLTAGMIIAADRSMAWQSLINRPAE